MLFHYANLVNDTPVRAIPGNSGLDSALKNSTISSVTKMGHFYNPYAPANAKPEQSTYWTIRMGGLRDEFLTKKAPDGASSFYRGLDFVYAPY